MAFIKMQRNSIFTITEGSTATGTTKVLNTLQPGVILSSTRTEDGNHEGTIDENNIENDKWIMWHNAWHGVCGFFLFFFS